jgi:hypothetical protein
MRKEHGWTGTVVFMMLCQHLDRYLCWGRQATTKQNEEKSKRRKNKAKEKQSEGKTKRRKNKAKEKQSEGKTKRRKNKAKKKQPGTETLHPTTRRKPPPHHIPGEDSPSTIQGPCPA